MSKPVPFTNRRQRLSDIGRIRAGYKEERTSKAGKKYKASVQHRCWILSAQSPENLETLAEIYGGTVKPWDSDDSTCKYRLITETERLEVVLPPEPLSEPRWQRWEGGFLTRDCGGVGTTCTAYPKGKDPVQVDCICEGLDKKTDWCKPKIHLSVILPQTPIGAWRLVTSSENAISELETSIEIIRAAGAVGFPRATLTRVDRKSGEKEFRVPTLTSAATFEQLEAAAAQAGTIGAGAGAAELGYTPMRAPAGALMTADAADEFWDDDEPVDAEVIEVVEAQEPATAPVSAPVASPAPSHPKRAPKSSPVQIGNLGPADVERYFMAMAPQDAEVLERVLSGIGLWPISSVSARKAGELVSIARPVIEQAVEEGRLEV